jgi:hypothetical protein
MTATRDAFVEARLREAAATAAWPPTPDLRPPVLARIEGAPRSAAVAPPVPGAEARRTTPTRRLALAVAVALVAILLIAGIAGALGFRLGAVDIRLVPTLPPVATPAAGAGLGLGSPIPVADARALAGPRVLVPGAMPAPDVAYVTGAGDEALVTLAWRADPGQPTLPGSDLAVTVMAVPGTTNSSLVSKMVSRGTTVEPVRVGGRPAWWIAGAPHEILVERPDTEIVVLPARLAGDTLVFTRDGTTYRIESTLGRDRTIAIAESLR